MNRRPDPKDRNILQMIRDDLSAFYNFNPWTRAVSYLLILISLGVFIYHFLKWIVNVVVDLAGTIQRATPTVTPTPDLQLIPTPIPTIWVPSPKVDQFIQGLFAPDNLRHCLVIALALILAFQLASAFYCNLYKIDKLSTSAALILRSIFLLPLGTIVINEKYLFSVAPAFQYSLEKGELSPDFRQEFKNHNTTLPSKPTIKTLVEDSEWEVIDSDKKKAYIVKKEDERLNIYHEKGEVSTHRPAEISMFRLRIASLWKRIQKSVFKKKSKEKSKEKSKKPESKDDKDAKNDNAHILRIGGPALVDIAPGHGAVFESADGEFRVIGPTGLKPAKILPFEKLYRVIDLIDHDIVLSIQSRTRDGKFETLKDVKFRYSVYRGRQAAQSADSSAFDPNALINLVRNYWLEGEWQSFAQELIKSDLRQFVTTRMSSDISPQPSPNLFRDFERTFNAQAQERGIQIQWTGSAAQN